VAGRSVVVPVGATKFLHDPVEAGSNSNPRLVLGRRKETAMFEVRNRRHKGGRKKKR